MTNQQDFESLPFLKIDGEPLSWQQALGYLWLFGQLRPLIQSIVSQHIIYQEIKQRDDLEVSAADFEQAVIDFRLQQKLGDSQSFQQWLTREGMDYAAFQNRVILNLKVEKLSIKIAEPTLNEYFEQRRHSLEQLELSCVITDDQSLAEDLKNRILNAQSSFEQIAQEYSLDKTSKVNVTRRTAYRQQWPQPLAPALESTQVGDIVGPLPIENRWGVFRVEQIIVPVLEGQLKRTLESQIFKEWLAEKVNQLTVQLAMTEQTQTTEQQSTV